MLLSVMMNLDGIWRQANKDGIPIRIGCTISRRCQTQVFAMIAVVSEKEGEYEQTLYLLIEWFWLTGQEPIQGRQNEKIGLCQTLYAVVGT